MNKCKCGTCGHSFGYEGDDIDTEAVYSRGVLILIEYNVQCPSCFMSTMVGYRDRTDAKGHGSDAGPLRTDA